MRVPSGVNGRLSSVEPGAGPFALGAPVLAFETATSLAGAVPVLPSTVPSARSSVTLERAEGASVAPGGSWCFPQPSASAGKNARNTGRHVVPRELLDMANITTRPGPTTISGRH